MPRVRSQILTNLDSLSEMLGGLSGIAEGLDDPRYMESIIRSAHTKAATAFDVAAAAVANGPALKHMYEYGVAGITPGPVKYTDPLSQSARLWEHTINGRGSQLNIGFNFRPAVNRNPQHTTGSTGVPSKYIRKLSRRKYVFWNKAFVMETGQPVEIKSKQNHGFLFIPTGVTEENQKGFVLWNTKTKGGLITQPGRDTKGTFAAFWMGWWAKEGEKVMSEDMERSVSMDVKAANAKAAKGSGGSLELPSPANNARAFKKGQKEIKVYFRHAGVGSR